MLEIPAQAFLLALAGLPGRSNRASPTRSSVLFHLDTIFVLAAEKQSWQVGSEVLGKEHKGFSLEPEQQR